jgi:outer membrane protein
MKLKPVKLLLLLQLMWVMAPAQQVHRFTIKEAVEMAFKNLPSLKNLELDYQIQEAFNKQITAAAYPQVSGTAGINHYLQLPQFLFPDATAAAIYGILKNEGVKDGSGNPISKDIPVTLRQVSFQQPWNASVGATVNQLLFQPDVFVGLKARATALEFSRLNVDVEKERVREQAYKQYYAVLIAEKQLWFIKDGITRLEKLKHDIEQLYKNGFAEKLDIDKTEVPLNNLKTSQNLLENAIRLNYASLKFAIGISQKDSIALSEQLTAEELKKTMLEENSFQYTERKEYQLLATARKLQGLDLKRQQLSNLPTVSFFMNYNLQGQSSKFITSKEAVWLRSSLAGIQLNMPIFNGFQRKYKIQEAQLKLNKIDNNTEQLKNAIDFEQTINRNVFKNALLNLDIQQRNIDLAKSIYNTTKKKYEQGLARSFELLQDENAIRDSESKYFDALYQAAIARVGYLKALGKLE